LPRAGSGLVSREIILRTFGRRSAGGLKLAQRSHPMASGRNLLHGSFATDLSSPYRFAKASSARSANTEAVISLHDCPPQLLTLLFSANSYGRQSFLVEGRGFRSPGKFSGTAGKVQVRDGQQGQKTSQPGSRAPTGRPLFSVPSLPVRGRQFPRPYYPLATKRLPLTRDPISSIRTRIPTDPSWFVFANASSISQSILRPAERSCNAGGSLTSDWRHSPWTVSDACASISPSRHPGDAAWKTGKHCRIRHAGGLPVHRRISPGQEWTSRVSRMTNWKIHHALLRVWLFLAATCGAPPPSEFLRSPRVSPPRAFAPPLRALPESCPRLFSTPDIRSMTCCDAAPRALA